MPVLEKGVVINVAGLLADGDNLENVTMKELLERKLIRDSRQGFVL